MNRPPQSTMNGQQIPPPPPPPTLPANTSTSQGQRPQYQQMGYQAQPGQRPPAPPLQNRPGSRPPMPPPPGQHNTPVVSQPGYPPQVSGPQYNPATQQYMPMSSHLPGQPIGQHPARPPMQQHVPPHQYGGYPNTSSPLHAPATIPQQQQQQQMGPNMAGLTQQMGGMSIQQQPGMASPPPSSLPFGAQHHKSRAKRIYPTGDPAASASATTANNMARPAGYPAIAQSGPMAQPGYPPSQSGYPSAPMQSTAPVGQPTFVPGAQAPTPVPASVSGPQHTRGGYMGVASPGAQPGMPQQMPLEPPKPRIDPDQMPSPIAVHMQDQENHKDQMYLTSLKTNVPLSSTSFTAIDEGNSNPRFIRMTMYNVPHTEELLKSSHLPLGMVVQPLADLSPSEQPVQLIDFGEEGPIRCLRCKTYINPYMVFIDGGKRFVCNMCRHENDVPEDYFCNLDMAGRRLDWDTHPELRNGSVDFVATKEFMARDPEPTSFVFAIDVTWTAVQNGMVAQAASALKDILYGEAGCSLPPGTKVGIITFDRSAHFYNLSASLEQAQMLVVPDIRDIFVPLNEGLVVDPIESQHVIEGLLDSLPTLFAQNRTAEPVLGAVVQAVHDGLRGRGGKLFVFQTSLPTLGPGTLRNRDDAKLHNTDKEKTLYEPQDSFYKEWAEKLVEEGICCNMYLFPSSYIDAATLGQLSTITGGEMYMYPGFHSDRDGRRFASDLCADTKRTYGGNAVLRIRTSDGLRIDEHFGNLYMRNHVDVELAGITSDTSIAASIQYDGKLDEKQDVYFQVALLYTTSDGQRRIRVHNLSIPCTTLIGNMFRHSEMDASMNLIAKMAVSEAHSTPLKQIREKLTDSCVQILTAYRRNCASGSSPGQLILPEAYKLSPLYTLALLKNPAIRGGADVPIDQRTYHMHVIRQMSVLNLSNYFYPRIIPVHSLTESEGKLDEKTGAVTLSTLVRCSYTRLDPAGAYLLVNNGSIMFWLGRQISPSFVQEALGASSLEQINVNTYKLPILDTELNRKIHAIIHDVIPGCGEFESVQIVRQGLDQSENQFVSLLIEDRNNDNMTYIDFVCAIHRQIQMEIRPKGPLEPKWTYN